MIADRITMLCFALFSPLRVLMCAVVLCSFRSDVLSLLRTYNCYHEGKNFQLRTREVRQWMATDKRWKWWNILNWHSQVTVTGLGVLGLQAIQHYKLACTNEWNWSELKTQHFDSQEDNEDKQPWDQIGNVAAIFLCRDLRFQVLFLNTPIGRQTTKKGPFPWNENGCSGYTFQTYTLTAQQSMSTVNTFLLR